MAEVSASQVKELREKTGAGMMDCKKALSETGGDFAKAEELLRKKGLSAAAKKATRAATDGSPIPPIVSYEWRSNNDTPTTYFVVAHVTVYYRHPLYVPLVSFFIDGVDGAQDERLLLSASEEMRVENPDVVVQGSSQGC